MQAAWRETPPGADAASKCPHTASGRPRRIGHFCSFNTVSFAWIAPNSALYDANAALNAVLYALTLLLLTVGWTHEACSLDGEGFLKLGALSMLCAILLGLATSLVQEITQQ